MANSTIPGLVAVSVPALTDLFGVRQSGDARDKKLTVTQLLTLIPSGGDVTKVGTPVDNQLGVWTGDGTIEGTTALAFDGSTFTMNLGGGDFRLTGKVELQGSNRPAVLNVSALPATVSFAPLGNSPGNGLGGQSTQVSLITGFKAGVLLTSLNSQILQSYETNEAVTAFAGGGQGSAVILGSSYNVLSVVATTGDSVKLPVVFESGDPATVIYIKNDGANAADVFPGSGDDLGAGVDTAVSLAAGESASFIATAGSTWTPWIVDTKGSGGAQISGTPANNQLGVWVNSTDIEGDVNWQIIGTLLRSTLGNGPGMVNLNGVNILPRHGDPNTGLQNVGDDRLAMVAGGVAGITLIEASGAVLPTLQTNVGITAFATGGQTSATQLNSGYNVVDTVATTGDSVKFSSLVNVGSLVYVKNDGANALDLFPAGGDDLGLGVGVAISVAAGKSVAFLGSVLSSTWTQLIFEEVAGGGDVTQAGVSANDRVAVFTADKIIEGTTSLLFNASGLQVDSAGGLLMSAAGGSIFFAAASTPAILNESATGTNPVFCPNKGDLDTGIGLTGLDALSLIAGGVRVANLAEVAGNVQIIVPLQDNAAAPSIAFGDGDSGFYENSDDIISVSCAGVRAWFFSSGSLGNVSGTGPRMQNEVPSATNPTFNPNSSDADTGIGHNAADQLSLVAGGDEIARAVEVVGANQFILTPGLLDNNPAAPTLAFGDGDTGFHESADDSLKVTLGGVDRWTFTGDSLVGVVGNSARLMNEGSTATNPTLIPALGDVSTGIGGVTTSLSLIVGGAERIHLDTSISTGNTFTADWAAANGTGPVIIDEASSLTNPTLAPNRGDEDTGIGHAGSDQLSLIAGGVSGLLLREINGGVIQVPDAEVALTAFATGGQANATVLNQSNNVIATVASTGDSVKLPSIFETNSVVFIKNDGVNAADVFPSTGDNLGAGTDTAVSLAAGESISFIATAASTTWTPWIVSVGGGGGDVTKVGTPVNNQIGVWTGDGTIEGDTGLTFTGSALVVAGAYQASDGSGPTILNVSGGFVVPSLCPNKTDTNTGIALGASDALSLVAGGIEMMRLVEAAADQILIIAGTAAAPALSFFADPDSGLYSVVPGIVAMSVDGTDRFRWVGNQFRGATGGSPSIQNEVASATNPTLLPSQTDLDTGIGRTGTDQLALVAGALDCMTVRETGGARQIGFYVTAPISLQTGVGVDAASIHAALVALGLITA